jgi:putative redox protein
MSLTVVWEGGMQFCAETKAGKLRCDESSAGSLGPSAPELLLASLGSCIASVIVIFGERHGMRLEGMAVHMDYKLADHPYRMGEISIAVHVPQRLTPAERATLERVAETCLIHATLQHPPKMTLELAGAP